MGQAIYNMLVDLSCAPFHFSHQNSLYERTETANSPYCTWGLLTLYIEGHLQPRVRDHTRVGAVFCLSKGKVRWNDSFK